MAILDRSMRQRLEAYVDLRCELRMQLARLQHMRETVGDVKSPTYAPGKTQATGDGVSRAVIALEELEKHVSSLSMLEQAEHDDLEAHISRLPNVHHRAILRMRYFDLMPWSRIARMLYGDQEDFNWSEREYVDRCYHLHTRAVSSLADVHALMFS